MDSTTKICRDCGEEKPLSQFYWDGVHRDGHHAYCMSCHRVRNRRNHEQRWLRKHGKQERDTNLAEKRCRVCGDVQAISEFSKRIDSPDGYRNECRTCKNAHRVEWRAARRQLIHDPNTTEKACRSCGVVKPLDSFHRQRRAIDGYRHDCIACHNEKALRSRFADPKYGVAPEGHRTCAKCGETKPLNQFHRDAQFSAGRDSWCKLCRNAAKREYHYAKPESVKRWSRQNYESRKESVRNYQAARRREMQLWFERLHQEQSCELCGEDDAVCLDYHHRDPATKLMAPSTMLRHSFSKEEILAEIAKCDILCSNCHRKLHRGIRARTLGALP